MSSLHARLALVAAGLALAITRPPLVAADVSSLRPWTNYHTILWVGDSAARRPEKLPLFFQRLREMGVTTAMVFGGGGDARPLLDNHFPYYVENIVNQGLCLKWNSKVSDWEDVVTRWAKTRDEAALAREYCLDDPQWRDWARARMREAARRHGTNGPVAYNIRDELSTTISANPFDYDFSPAALAGFREWLKTQYGSSLDRLNRSWETRFESWGEVKPFTTDQIKSRMASGQALPPATPDWPAVAALRFVPARARESLTRWNLAPWADFRTYMDLSLARALDDLRQVAHEVDPRTPVGIEGTQMPHAFGGYDLWRPSQAVDWVEPYDIGNAREIFGSFMPGRPILTTVFEHETNPARRRLWHLLLEGDRGCVVWWSEDCIAWQSADYALTPKARALAPVLKELTSPLARLFLAAWPIFDPIAILYSQPSIQVDWLIESCPDGSTWLRRFSSFEADHNRMARVRNSWLKAFQDLGYSPRFMPAVGLEGQAWPNRVRVLVLPGAIALSDRESASIDAFLQPSKPVPGRLVFADGTPGLFDEHGRLRATNLLERFFPAATSEERCFAARSGEQSTVGVRDGDIASYGRERLTADFPAGWADCIQRQPGLAPPEVAVPLSARLSVRRYAAGRAQLVAFERNVDYQMSEDLKQAGGNRQLETPVEVTARLAHAAHVCDLRTKRYLGRLERITFTVDPWQPSLFALLPEPPATGDVVELLLEELRVPTAGVK